MRHPSKLGLLSVVATVTAVTLTLAGVGLLRGSPARAAVSPIADPTAVDAIPFDHSIHVGKYGMKCLDCHVYATESQVAGLPALRKCIGCHKFVAKQKPAVQALAKLWREKKAPRWHLHYQLPDYVYFSHEMHLNAKLKCQTCHGNVGQMHQIRRVSSLDMGWCISCHQKHHATLSCVACHK